MVPDGVSSSPSAASSTRKRLSDQVKESSEPPHKRSLMVAPFIESLWEMVNSEAISCIDWKDNGDEFVVHDPDQLAAEVLGLYFKHNKFSSFVRQLNFYRFVKTSEPSTWSWKHESFQKGKPQLLSHIKRRAPNSENSTGAHKLLRKLPEGVQSEFDRRQAELEGRIIELELSRMQMLQEFRIGRQEQARMKREIATLSQQLSAVMSYIFTQTSNGSSFPAGLDPRRMLLKGPSSDIVSLVDANESINSVEDGIDNLVEPIKNVSIDPDVELDIGTSMDNSSLPNFEDYLSDPEFNSSNTPMEGLFNGTIDPNNFSPNTPDFMDQQSSNFLGDDM
jgi:heat shock transcription factor